MPIHGLIDIFKRKIDYLRLSVTDRCNLRCAYCLPERFSRFVPCAEILSDDEIVELVSVFVEFGVSKVRITGGEPLVRPNLGDLIARMPRINGIDGISFCNRVRLNSL